MKVVSVWQDSGVITLVRDSTGDLYIPKKRIQASKNIRLFTPINETIKPTDILIPSGVLCFVDSLNDTISDSVCRLHQLTKGTSDSNILIVTASDSVERKGALAECGVNSSKKTRILEVTLPISCLSPTLTAGRLTYADIVSRRKTNFPRKDIYEILSQESYLTSLDKLTFYILQQFILHNEVCFPEKQDGASYSASEYDVLSQVFIHSDLIPFRLTGNRAIPLAPSDYTEAASQNPRHGIVKRLRRIENHPTLPSSLITVQSDVADLRSASCWANNTVCQGSSFNNLHNAELSALGEAYERYCVNIIDPYKVVIGSANSLKRNGLTPVNPSDFVLFTPEQIHNFGGRFEGFHNETVTTWTTGKTFKGEEKLVPVSMVFVNHRRLQKLGDYPLPHINAPAYAGISAGRTVTSACVNALQELMERHATMCWWHNPPHGVRLSVEKDSFIGNLVTEFENKGNVVSIVNIENRFHVPIYAATVLNVESGIVNTGFGCRLTNEAAILKALTEACTLQAGSFDLLNPSGELFMAIERGELWEGIAKPWRQDRRYLDYYLSDFSTMNDLMLQQQVYLDWRLLSRVRPWLFPQQTARGYFYPDCHFENLDDELNYYVKILDSMSLEPVMIDVTSPDVQTLQISVIRVIVPGLVPNFAVGDLHLGNHVIQNEPVLLGYQKEPTSLDKLNVYPLPHC